MRIGAAFTRFQTLLLRDSFDNNSSIVSYGPCQFPTLGFVARRFQQREKFASTPFWSLDLTYTDPATLARATFAWQRGRCYDRHVTAALLHSALSAPHAVVLDTAMRGAVKRRPVPLTTVEMQVLASRHLKMPARHSLEVAEALYQTGFISYPRTETSVFSREFDIVSQIGRLGSGRVRAMSPQECEVYDREQQGANSHNNNNNNNADNDAAAAAVAAAAAAAAAGPGPQGPGPAPGAQRQQQQQRWRLPQQAVAAHGHPRPRQSPAVMEPDVYADLLLTDPGAFEWPAHGGHDDGAHPPIHPLKPPTADITGDHRRLYDLIVRHFLASCSGDARGSTTKVSVQCGTEVFATSGLMVSEYNYLRVFKWDKWSESTVPLLYNGMTFAPASVSMREGATVAPLLLTEAELLGLMNSHGIGTDATMAAHIDTIITRKYVSYHEGTLTPTPLGLALIKSYDAVKIALAEPSMRARMEASLALISAGKTTKATVVAQCCAEMLDVLQKVQSKGQLLLPFFEKALAKVQRRTETLVERFSHCGHCKECSMELVRETVTRQQQPQPPGQPGQEVKPPAHGQSDGQGCAVATHLVLSCPSCGGFGPGGYAKHMRELKRENGAEGDGDGGGGGGQKGEGRGKTRKSSRRSRSRGMKRRRASSTHGNSNIHGDDAAADDDGDDDNEDNDDDDDTDGGDDDSENDDDDDNDDNAARNASSLSVVPYAQRLRLKLPVIKVQPIVSNSTSTTYISPGTYTNPNSATYNASSGSYTGSPSKGGNGGGLPGPVLCPYCDYQALMFKDGRFALCPYCKHHPVPAVKDEAAKARIAAALAAEAEAKVKAGADAATACAASTANASASARASARAGRIVIDADIDEEDDDEVLVSTDLATRLRKRQQREKQQQLREQERAAAATAAAATAATNAPNHDASASESIASTKPAMDDGSTVDIEDLGNASTPLPLPVDPYPCSHGSAASCQACDSPHCALSLGHPGLLIPVAPCPRCAPPLFTPQQQQQQQQQGQQAQHGQVKVGPGQAQAQAQAQSQSQSVPPAPVSPWSTLAPATKRRLPYLTLERRYQNASAAQPNPFDSLPPALAAAAVPGQRGYQPPADFASSHGHSHGHSYGHGHGQGEASGSSGSSARVGAALLPGRFWALVCNGIAQDGKPTAAAVASYNASTGGNAGGGGAAAAAAAASRGHGGGGCGARLTVANAAYVTVLTDTPCASCAAKGLAAKLISVQFRQPESRYDGAVLATGCVVAGCDARMARGLMKVLPPLKPGHGHGGGHGGGHAGSAGGRAGAGVKSQQAGGAAQRQQPQSQQGQFQGRQSQHQQQQQQQQSGSKGQSRSASGNNGAGASTANAVSAGAADVNNAGAKGNRGGRSVTPSSNR